MKCGKRDETAADGNDVGWCGGGEGARDAKEPNRKRERATEEEVLRTAWLDGSRFDRNGVVFEEFFFLG